MRPLTMWDNLIEVDGKTVKRFEYVGDGKRLDNLQDIIECFFYSSCV